MKKGAKKRLLVFTAAIAIFGSYFMYRFARWLVYRYTHAVTEDAFVEADIINISPLVSGHIKKILVDESEKVAKGQTLFIIDDSDYRADVRLKKAKVKAAAERLMSLKEKLKKEEKAYELIDLLTKKEVEAARYELQRVKAEFERVSKDYRRFKALYQKNAVEKRKFDVVLSEYMKTKDLLKIKEISLKMAIDRRKEVEIKKHLVYEIKKEVDAAEKELEAAKRALDAAIIKLSHTVVKSPIDGVVAKKYLFEGDFAAPGYPVLAVYDPRKIYVLANLEETRFRGVRVGNPVDIKVDAYPGMVFKGRVSKILRASAAKFALIPRDVTSGEFTKVVQRIPIKIKVVSGNRRLLIPGMSVFVGIKR